MNKNLINYSIPHVIHNNLANLIKERSNDNNIPMSFPFENFEQKENKETLKVEQYTKNQSCNVNIILNSTAIVENSLECIIISPFNNIDSETSKTIKSSLLILKNDLIKVSSLGRYFDYYQKIYDKKIKDIIETDELSSLNLLFDIRHMIIHCSALSAKIINEEKRVYLYVDDPFYLEILRKVKKLMNLDSEYYCLPESLLCWNNLVDVLLKDAHKVIVKLTEYSKTVLPYIEIPLFYYGIDGFIKYGQVK